MGNVILENSQAPQPNIKSSTALLETKLYRTNPDMERCKLFEMKGMQSPFVVKVLFPPPVSALLGLCNDEK